MIQRKLKKELHKIGMREMVPPEVIEAIFNSQFEFARRAVQEGSQDEADTFKCVGFKYFGKLNPRRHKVEEIKKRKK